MRDGSQSQDFRRIAFLDTFSPEERSWIMRQVRSRDTNPEKLVRSLLHAMGYRFRLHRRDLPGCPDIVLPRYDAIIFVHGCFWHRHRGCPRSTMPASNKAYWLPKFERTVARDARNTRQLRRLGWRVMTVWECQTADRVRLAKRLASFLTT